MWVKRTVPSAWPLAPAEGMVALGRLNLDGTKLGGLRYQDFPDGKWQACVNRHDVA